MPSTPYLNPLCHTDFPDPSIIYVKNQGFFAYATHDEFSPTINNILVSHSWDLVNWSVAKGAIATPPVWAKNCQRFWCPQVVEVNNEFRLYYAAEPDTKDGMCLAMAVSNTPFNFIDCGKPIGQMAGSTYQMIDPCFFIDPVSNKYLLYYGSAHQAIKVVEVGVDGVTFLTEPVEVLQPGTGKFQALREGAFVTYDAGRQRYFLWVSGDNTWASDSYAISVFWAETPTGKFSPVPANHVVVAPNKKWDSPGQNCIINGAAGAHWIVYHAVDKGDPYILDTTTVQRKMCMDKLLYTAEGWPYIKNGSPSFEWQDGPET